jgi:hypothetical protein
MPSLRRSLTRKQSYAGESNRTHLIQALNLLFFIKGTRYQKNHPEFVIPTAGEFLSYARALSDETYNSNRKGIAIVKYKHGASPSHARKIIQTRPLSPTTRTNGQTLPPFLQYILNTSESVSIITTLHVCIYAVGLYVFINLFLLNPEKTPDAILHHPEFSPRFVGPLVQFIQECIPQFTCIKTPVITALQSMIQPIGVLSSAAIKSTNASALAESSVQLLEPYVNGAAFKQQVLRPVADALRRCGVEINSV